MKAELPLNATFGRRLLLAAHYGGVAIGPFEIRPAPPAADDGLPGRAHYCSGCGAEVGIHQVFCGDCGLRLPAEGFVASVLAAGSSVSDERKRVTVLFADIVESTALISKLDLEQGALRLDPMLQDMATTVKRHGGFVSGLRGDGIKAVFGIPLTLEDHAERACASALEIRAMARRGRVRIRAGLHSGEVLVRLLRLAGWTEYDAVGPSVHLAARLEQTAQPGSIHLSAATANLVAGRFRLRSAGKTSAKGIIGAVEVFQLVGEANRTRWAARSRGGLSELVGRSVELESLVRWLRGSEPVIYITGEAGSGKSRLLYELGRRRELAAWNVMKAEVEADDDHAGLRPFAQMLRSWLGVERSDPPAMVRDRLGAHLRPLGIAPVDVCALQCLLDVGGLETCNDKDEIMSAMTRLIACQAERQPTLVIVEDVHWLAEDAYHLVQLLSEVATAGRLAIIVSSRPPGRPQIHTRHTLVLGPLSPTHSLELLNSRLGLSPEFETIKLRIMERAGGIPLFLEELVKFCVELSDADSLVPDSVHAVIGERIDRLPNPARDVLRIASVIGRESPLPVLCSVAGRSAPELTTALLQIEEGGFAKVCRRAAEPWLEFSHALIRDVTVAGLLTNARRGIHAAILESYETLYPARLDELVEKLGAHALEASAWEKAGNYFRKAAQKAIDRSHHASAIRFVELALEALSRSSFRSNEKDERELTLRLLLRTAYNAIGNYRQRLGNLDRAETLAHHCGREEFLPTIWVSRASALLNLGQVDAAIQILEAARDAGTSRADHEAAVISGYMLCRTYFYAGRLTESLALGNETFALLKTQSASQRHGGGFGSSRVMLLTQLTQTQAHLGLFRQAKESAAEALAAAYKSERSFDIALANYGLGVVHLLYGDLTTVIPQLKKGASASATEGAQSIHAALIAMLGYAHLCAGEMAESLTLVRRALSHPEKSLYIGNWPRLFGSLILHVNGASDEALQLSTAARRIARKGPYPVQSAWTELVRGYLYRDVKAATAARHFDRALAQAQLLKLRPCAARALVEAARLKSRAGCEEEARQLWQRATSLAGEMGIADMTQLAWSHEQHSVIERQAGG